MHAQLSLRKQKCSLVWLYHLIFQGLIELDIVENSAKTRTVKETHTALGFVFFTVPIFALFSHVQFKPTSPTWYLSLIEPASSALGTPLPLVWTDNFDRTSTR